MPKLLVLLVSLVFLSSPVAAAPELLASVPSKHAINGVEVIDGYAYVADTYALRVIDVRDPAKPRVTWTSPRMRSYAEAIRRVGPDTIYMLATPAGSTAAEILIYRIVRPGVVKRVGSLRLPGAITNTFHVRGNLVYVPGGTGGLFIVDATRPLTPRIAATEFFGADGVGDVAFEGNRMWASLGRWKHGVDALGPSRSMVHGSSLAVVDVSDPRQPRLLDEVMHGLGSERIAVHDGIGYVPHGSHDLSIVDLRAEGAPELNRIRLDSTHVGFAFAEGGLLLAGTKPLTVFDISSPANPRAIQTFDGSGDTVRDVRFVDGMIFVAGHQFGGLRILGGAR